jgi:hypothetical protein
MHRRLSAATPWLDHQLSEEKKRKRKPKFLWSAGYSKAAPAVTCILSSRSRSSLEAQPTRPSIRIAQAPIGRAEAEVPTCRGLVPIRNFAKPGIIDLKSRIRTTTRLVPDSPSAASPHTP